VFKPGDPDIPNIALQTPGGLPRMSRSYASEPTVDQAYIARMFEGDPMPKMISRIDEVRAETEALLASGDDSPEAQARLEELIEEQALLEPAQSKPRRRKSRNNRKKQASA
jgi:CelD/BcsL family acetyltransferase involved in cellulose biosynthesis